MLSVIGAKTLSYYAAANACVDALCLNRCAKKLPATSIQWGAWSSVGMAVDETFDRNLVPSLDIEKAMLAFELYMKYFQLDYPVCTIADVNWKGFIALSNIQFKFDPYIREFYKISNGLNVSWDSHVFETSLTESKTLKNESTDQFIVAEDELLFAEAFAVLSTYSAPPLPCA